MPPPTLPPAAPPWQMPPSSIIVIIISLIASALIFIACALTFSIMRHRARSRRDKEQMATQLQRTWRGHAHRKRADELRVERDRAVTAKMQRESDLLVQKQHEAASKLQEVALDFVGRRRDENGFILFVTCRLQASTRRFLVQARLRLIMRHRAAEYIQASYRRLAARHALVAQHPHMRVRLAARQKWSRLIYDVNERARDWLAAASGMRPEQTSIFHRAYSERLAQRWRALAEATAYVADARLGAEKVAAASIGGALSIALTSAATWLSDDKHIVPVFLFRVRTRLRLRPLIKPPPPTPPVEVRAVSPISKISVPALLMGSSRSLLDTPIKHSTGRASARTHVSPSPVFSPPPANTARGMPSARGRPTVPPGPSTARDGFTSLPRMWQTSQASSVSRVTGRRSMVPQAEVQPSLTASGKLLYDSPIRRPPNLADTANPAAHAAPSPAATPSVRASAQGMCMGYLDTFDAQSKSRPPSGRGDLSARRCDSARQRDGSMSARGDPGASARAHRPPFTAGTSFAVDGEPPAAAAHMSARRRGADTSLFATRRATIEPAAGGTSATAAGKQPAHCARSHQPQSMPPVPQQPRMPPALPRAARLPPPSAKPSAMPSPPKPAIVPPLEVPGSVVASVPSSTPMRQAPDGRKRSGVVRV